MENNLFSSELPEIFWPSYNINGYIFGLLASKSACARKKEQILSSTHLQAWIYLSFQL